MAMNPSKIKPVEVMRLLNSTRQGEVLNESKLARHRNSAGFKISDDGGQTVNLFKYAAWLREKMLDRQNNPPQTYEDKKAAARNRNIEMALAGRDIGELPAVADPERKKSCKRNFQLFCESYFPETYTLDWSPDHLKAIRKIETGVLQGGLFALAMPRGSGKALALDTPLPTPTGWATMGDIKIGDWLFDEKGYQCQVVMKSSVFTGHDCYRVTFNDGESIVCDAGHLWQIKDIFGRKNPYVRTTEWLASRYKIGKRGYHESRFRIPMPNPIQTQSGELPIAPYALGVWLGDGTCVASSITLFDRDSDEIARNIRRELGIENFTVCSYGQEDHAVLGRLSKAKFRNVDKEMTGQCRLRKMNLLNNKHIPKEYLRADVADRRALLQGIMDTDGHADAKGYCEICIKYPLFAEGFGELLSSLGIKYGVAEKKVLLNGIEHGPYYRFGFNGHRDQEIFQLVRKQERMRIRPSRRVMKKMGCLSHTPCDVRTIINMEKVPSVPTQCVMVDSPSHLYLAGRKMVPTHNSSLAETACLWSMLYGHREFVGLIGATEAAALEMLDSIKTELEVNETLAGDFPEVSFPIAALDGIANRCAGQLYKGERTRITWTSNEIVLPTIVGSKASGIVVRVAGITGRVRGMKFKRADGRSVRPSLVIIDDPQTSESAGSLEQTRKRVRVLAGDILGLAGPGQKISGIMPCTIIRPGDMAEQILDKVKHPEWNGERTKMLYKLPSNEKLWEEYAEIRADALREDGNIERATEFYRNHQIEMDLGAQVAWEARFNHDEISAIQHAMNLKLQDEIAFWSEYQNEPLPEDLGSEEQLSIDQVIHKLNGRKMRDVPVGCNHLSMFIDVQKNLLFYMVCAWEDDFTGYVIDYGAYPDQQRRYFSLNDANPTLGSVSSKSGMEGSIYAGLERLTEEFLSKEFRRDDGAMMKIGRCLIDANWGQSTEVVYQFCRQSAHSAVIVPSHGKYIGASSRPMSEYKKSTGDRVGHNWRIPNVAGKRSVRHVIYDTNYWKTFIHARFFVAMGDHGCLSLWGRDPERHLLLAEHLTAEYKVRTTGHGRSVDEWKMRPDGKDNHWLDSVVGCAVGASMLGAILPGTDTPKAMVSRPILKLSELQKKKR